MKVVFLLLAIFLSVYAETVRFDEHRVYSINAKNNEQLNILREIENSATDGYLFWNSISAGHQIDLMVEPHKLQDFIDVMNGGQFSYQLRIENVQT